MIVPRASLTAVGVVFVGLGILFLIDPEKMAAMVGILARQPRPSTEIRAMYGGLEIGLGLFFLTSCFRIRWIRAALAAQILILGGLGLGRVAGLLLTDSIDRRMTTFAVIELVGSLIGVFAFRRAKQELRSRTDRRVYE